MGASTASMKPKSACYNCLKVIFGVLAATNIQNPQSTSGWLLAQPTQPHFERNRVGYCAPSWNAENLFKTIEDHLGIFSSHPPSCECQAVVRRSPANPKMVFDVFLPISAWLGTRRAAAIWTHWKFVMGRGGCISSRLDHSL